MILNSNGRSGSHKLSDCPRHEPETGRNEQNLTKAMLKYPLRVIEENKGRRNQKRLMHGKSFSRRACTNNTKDGTTKVRNIKNLQTLPVFKDPARILTFTSTKLTKSRRE